MQGIAFKVTYNDGGATPGGLIGYQGVCSNAAILENVRTRKMTNCSREDGPCRKFVDGNFAGPKPTLLGREPWCYESTLLSRRPWRFGAGIYHHGPKEGQLIPMRQASIGDIVFLTTAKPGAPEADRFVFATFRIGEISDDAEWGTVVESDGTMDVRIPDEIAPLNRFWNYYRNADGSEVWGTGLFRYLSENVTGEILADLMGWLEDQDAAEIIYDAIGRSISPRLSARCRGGGGEGDAHKALKERVASNPTLLGLPQSAIPTLEYPFVSGDQVDIKFDLPDGRQAIVEIETTIPFPGAHQCVKYRALLEAERGDLLGSGTVDAFLVAYRVDADTRSFAEKYGICVIELPPRESVVNDRASAPSHTGSSGL